MYFIIENQYNKKEILEFNKGIRLNYVDEKEGPDLPAKNATKTSTVRTVRYKDVAYYLGNLLEKCKITNIDHGGYSLFEPTDFNLLNYNIYEKGQEYGWHADVRTTECFDMKWTLLINLSDEEYEGGDLEIFEGGIQTVKEFRKPGNAVMFKSHMQHRVTPVTSGVRKTLTYWFVGPRFI